MSEKFSDEWTKNFSTARGADARITVVPKNIGFNPIIGCSFKGEVMSFGVAYISKKLQIIVCNSGAIMKNIRISFPFMNNFALMGKV